MNTLKLTIIACGFIFFLSCGDSSQKQTNAPANNSKAAATSPQAAATPAADVASGAKLYAANCQICHQNTGKGGKNLTVGGKKLSPEDLTADKFKKHSDDALVEHISEGVPDEECRALRIN